MKTMISVRNVDTESLLRVLVTDIVHFSCWRDFVVSSSFLRSSNNKIRVQL